MKTLTFFKGTFPKIKNSLIAAIWSVMNEFIREELDKTEFVVILLDKASDITKKSELSAYLHRMNGLGDIKENSRVHRCKSQ